MVINKHVAAPVGKEQVMSIDSTNLGILLLKVGEYSAVVVAVWCQRVRKRASALC